MSHARTKKKEKAPASPRRTATYGAATRLARIVHSVLTQPGGRSFTGIQAELRISERTLLRYIAACKRHLVDPSGRPLLEVAHYGARRPAPRQLYGSARLDRVPGAVPVLRPHRVPVPCRQMTVHGTEELRNWILGFGPWVKVLKPKSLRDEVAALHAEAARPYGPGR